MKSFVAFFAFVSATYGGLLAPTSLPYAAGYLPTAYNTVPVAYNNAPIISASIPASPISSQFQAQDEFGNINYGYSNVNSAKQEVGNAYGGVTGSYQYIDANGIPQRVEYIADALGFRVKATNLPVGPAVPEAPVLSAPEPVVYNGVAPEQVEDTDDVKLAKAEFFAAFEEAKNREKRQAVLPISAPLGLINSYGYPASLAYNQYNSVSTPAAREAVLTQIKLPNALTYRVD